ncbi:MAG: V-type ATP synthase subunit F [Nitrospirota bacterium]|jgi:vacuolar-type H+-ATPase subunit F/Vma7
MANVVFIGDEVAAAGFRLAGARVVVPQAGRAAEALATARDEADLVLIGAETADGLPHAVLGEAIAARSPLVFVVPDVRGRITPPDPVASLQGQLGVTE